MSKVVVTDLKATAERLAQAIRRCSSEEDLRVNMELILRDVIPDLPVPKYEQTIRTSTFPGRADAVHHGLVIEYEKPRTLRVATKADHALHQVWGYLIGLALPNSDVQEPQTQAQQRNQ